MYSKAQAIVHRGLMSAKNHAANLYQQGRGVLKKIDYGYSVFRRLHSALKPALADYPETSKQIKRAMNSYEQTRSQVTGIHAAGEAIVSNVRQRVPELGL